MRVRDVGTNSSPEEDRLLLQVDATCPQWPGAYCAAHGLLAALSDDERAPPSWAQADPAAGEEYGIGRRCLGRGGADTVPAARSREKESERARARERKLRPRAKIYITIPAAANNIVRVRVATRARLVVDIAAVGHDAFWPLNEAHRCSEGAWLDKR